MPAKIGVWKNLCTLVTIKYALSIKNCNKLKMLTLRAQMVILNNSHIIYSVCKFSRNFMCSSLEVFSRTLHRFLAYVNFTLTCSSGEWRTQYSSVVQPWTTQRLEWSAGLGKCSPGSRWDIQYCPQKAFSNKERRTTVRHYNSALQQPGH